MTFEASWTEVAPSRAEQWVRTERDSRRDLTGDPEEAWRLIARQLWTISVRCEATEAGSEVVIVSRHVKAA